MRPAKVARNPVLMASDPQFTPEMLVPVASLTVRGDELGENGKVSPSNVLRWLEHGRWAALSGDDESMRRLFSEGHIVVVRAQKVAFLRELDWNERVQVSIGLAKVGRTSCEFAQQLRAPGNVLIAEARISVVHLGGNRRPAEIPADVRSRSLELGVPDALQRLEPVDLTGQPVHFTHTFSVRPSDIDVFHHVNHARYLDYAEDLRALAELADALPGWKVGRSLAAVSIDYAREALVRDVLTAECMVLSPTELAWRLRRGEVLLTSGRLRVHEIG